MIGTSGAVAIKHKIDNTPTLATPYGYIYNAAVATEKNGKLLNSNWHVATQSDWDTLINYLGGYDLAGDKLKQSTTSSWMGPTSPATNISDFTALATGERDCISIEEGSTGYIYRGEMGCWWSSDYKGYSPSGDLYFSINMDSTSVVRTDYTPQQQGMAIRCVANSGFTPGSTVVDYDSNSYDVVQIGTQYWIKSDIKTTHYSNGVAIPHVLNYYSWYHLNTGATNDAYCIYNEIDTTPPTIKISSVSNITYSSSDIVSNLISIGGSVVTSCGICYSYSNIYPTTSDSVVNRSTSLGSVTSSISPLLMGGTYYVRAYAINSYGKVYSNMVSFKTKDWNSQIDYWSFNDIVYDYIDANGEIIYGTNGFPLTLVNVSKGLSKNLTHNAINFSATWLFYQPRLEFDYNIDLYNFGQFTIMGWFLPFIDDGTERYLLSMPEQLYIKLGDYFDDDSNNYISVYDNKSGRIVYGVIQLSKVGDTPGIWSHIVVTCDRTTNTIKIYINNVDVTTVYKEGTLTNVSFNNNIHAQNSCYFNIGSYHTDQCNYIGNVDELRVYNVIPDSEEITRIYNLPVE
jgi:uncharacterized protein (TIGR02145 family)